MSQNIGSNLVQILWVALRVENPETARVALLTMTDNELAGLNVALAEAVDFQPSLAAEILPPAEWLSDHARLLQPDPAPPRQAVE